MQIKTGDVSQDRVSATVPQGVDGAVGVSGRKWFVAMVNSRHEKSASAKLQQINVENYVATQTETRVWSNGRRKTVERVVIPSVVFVRCTEQERRDIVRLPYINRFMVNRTVDTGGLNSPAATIPDVEIVKLKFMLGQSDYPVEFTPAVYRLGDPVRVLRGSLRGLEGHISATPDGTHTLTVRLPHLGGATLRISSSDLEKLTR